MTMLDAVARLDFELPTELEASAPAEVRGRGRDDVRLLVASRSTGAVAHHRFPELPSLLRAGDVVVINVSATLPAALDVTDADGRRFVVHLSTRLPGGLWAVEVRSPDATASVPHLTARPGDVFALAGRSALHLLAPYPETQPRPRLWVAMVTGPAAVDALLATHGRPIRYGYVRQDWPLSAYQTVYATEPGSAEMPSAGRAFTAALITALVAEGVWVAPLVLHTGVSSQEEGEPPLPEPYRVPAATARLVNAARAGGGRLIAVGTTVTRALETVAERDGTVHAGAGWTELVIGPERGVRAVDGILTGWHEPRASHLHLLEAVAGRELLEVSYAAALDARYLWHEFGDLHLILP